MTTSITTRAGKGSPLTHDEVDANFTNLQTTADAALPLAGGTMTGPVAMTGGTVTTSAPLIDATQTWNAAGVTFTGWKLNVTDTASASGSLLADFQVGGVSKAQITVDGKFVAGKGYVYARPQFFDSNYGAGSGFQIKSDRELTLYTYDTAVMGVSDGSTGVRIHGSISLGFVDGHAIANDPDVRLWRDAAATLALRNSTNAQTLRVYGTYTDSSNYVRASLSSSSTAVTLAAETAGTGADNIDVTFTPAGTGVVASGAPIKTQSTTVAGLMSAATAGSGARAFVTDATATTFLSTVAGGGSNKVPVVSDGTNWLIG